MLILLGLLSLVLFAVPARYKYGVMTGLMSVGIVTALTAACLSLAGADTYNEPFRLFFRYAFPQVDRLSAVFLIIVSVAALSVTLYTKDYVKEIAERKSDTHLSIHYTGLVWMYLSMLAVAAFQEGFVFLISWELMTIASFLLILFNGEKRIVRRAAINYLILMHVGFVFLLAGFVLGSGDGSFGGFYTLRYYFAGHNPIPVFLLFLVGFGMKAGIFPLHVWQPEAYPAAPAHVSAFMSGAMSKMGIYGMLRVLSAIESEQQTIGLILLFTGIVTALWGIWQASMQNDLKKLLAYSSSENIGIIFIGLGAGTLGLASGNHTLALLGYSGALLHTINHSLFKPVLFMGAGSVEMAAHTRNLDELGGLSKRMPFTTGFFLIGLVSICALPPFNGFVSEFLIYLGMLKSAASGTMVVWSMIGIAGLALVGGIAVLVFGKAFGIGFLGAPRSAKVHQAEEVSTGMLAAQTIPLAGILLIGLCPVFFGETIASVVVELFRSKIPFFSVFGSGMESLRMFTLIMGTLLLLICLLGWWRRKAHKKQIISESPTWGCGFTAPNERMQYTGESFSEGIQNLLGSTVNDYQKKNSVFVPKSEIFARKHGFKSRHKDQINSLIANRWVYFVRKMNARLALFQTGKINHYILHALLFLILVFLISWIGLI